MEGALCRVTGKDCLLGTSYDTKHACELNGNFDVWVTIDDDVLISDIGSPSPEPKRSVVLGVNQDVALEVAELTARTMSSAIITSQQKCRKCGCSYWIAEHECTKLRVGRRYFCPDCIRGFEGKSDVFDFVDYWCG